MTAKNQIYVCPICGNIVEMLHEGDGTLVCCGKPMILQEANSVDAALEKHVPVIEKTANGFKVKVGSIEHPMTNDHYIELIEVICDNELLRVFLGPNDKPEAEFNLPGEKITARAYCNLHGLWQSEN